MEKYYEKKAIRNGAKRECSKCKGILSRYNESEICSACQKRINLEHRNKIVGMINEVS
jgi:hypothetical protein